MQAGSHLYFDNNATTQPLPSVADAVQRALTEFWHNPSSIHRPGQAVRQQVDLARRACADLIGAKHNDLTFTSGGTEALDLAIRGITMARRSRQSEPPLIVTTKVEHASIRDLCESLEKKGLARIRWLALDTDPGRRGVIRTDALGDQVTSDAALVCLQWANNETGALQPVSAVSAAARAAGVPLLVDAVQWVGKMPASVTPGSPYSIDCDALVFSPHKFHGVKGVGVLWARPGLKFSPTLHGSQELGRRGGTENVPGIMGAGVAARETAQWLADPARRDEVSMFRDHFEAAVLTDVKDAHVNGPVGPGVRLWNTTNIAFPRLEAEAMLLLLSERGVCASAGAACSSGSLDPSPVLLAMGVPEANAHGSLRFSLSRLTTYREVEVAARVVIECVATLRRSLP